MERDQPNPRETKEGEGFIFAAASAPGRICLAGESLDWMTGGPSIVAAVDLRTSVSIKPFSQESPFISIYSGNPFNAEKLLPLGEFEQYDYEDLNYIQAALRVF